MSVAKLRSKVISHHGPEHSAAAARTEGQTLHSSSAAAPRITPTSPTTGGPKHTQRTARSTTQHKVTRPSMATATTTMTKTAVKSGATTTATTAAAAAATTTQQQTYLPLTTASLLKIEPFVPSYNVTRPRPPIICRSHSTLSRTHLTHTLNYLSTQNAPVAVRRHNFVLGSTIADLMQKPPHPSAHARRRPSRYVLPRQRSKSNSSSASLQPPSKNIPQASCSDSSSTCGTTSSAALVTHQANGICHIVRPPQEREKLPDRINYDRRGLTAIPIFEHETNLRLLSLQHNLINVFHIPGEQSQGEATAAVPAEELKKAQGNQNGRSHISGRAKSSRGRLQINNINSGINLMHQLIDTNLLPSKPSSMSGSILQRSVLYPSATKQQLLQQHRLTLKKSKSFASNYTLDQHRDPPLNVQSSRMTEKTLSNKKLMAALSATNLKSFDSGVGTSILTTTTDSNSTLSDEQLTVTNKQLVITYGPIFRNLVFLDLYNNQIERIANLDGLPALTVLLLGKNRVSDISGLSSLGRTLRVLDLHGNKIASVSHKLNCLQELKSLNLAGNHIRQINPNDFKGLKSLKELNLKRNRLKRISGFEHLVALERLWLCHNDLHKVEDMSTIAKAINLLEVTIEDNPVCLAGDCVSFLVSYLPRLQSLNQMPITEQVRHAALAWRKNQEHSEANHSRLSSDAFNSIRREQVISNARTNWELLRSQQTTQNTTRKLSPQLRELTGTRDTRESVVGSEELEEFFKLPPIQRPQQETTLADNNECFPGDRNRSSNSSLSPNVDSSSCYSSGDEDSDPLKINLDACAEKRYRTKSSQPRGLPNEEKPSKDLNNHSEATETLPDESQRNADQLDASNSSSLTAAHSNQQQDDVISAGRDSNSSLHGTSSACVTKLPQADKPDGGRPAGASPSTMTLPRGTATATLITGSSSSLNLSNPNKNNNNNNTGLVANSDPSTPKTFVTPGASLRRYMQGSLMRSHTVVGGRGAAKSNLTSKANGNQSQQRQRQRQHQQNLVTNNGTDQSRSVHLQTISCMVGAAATTMPITQTANISASKSSGAIHPSSSGTTIPKVVADREREQGGDYLIEISGHYLNVYGQGALRYIDKQWSPAKANDVHTLNFSYINFNNIAAILGRIKVRFPYAENFVFRETNISCLGQLNALAELLGIASLYIDPEGNAITTKDLWHLYAVYRLSHWGLKLLNGREVSEAEVEEANSMYAGLSDLVLWAMPDTMLQPLLARLRLDETCNASKLTPKEWLTKGEKSLRIVVGKEALQWKKPTSGGGDGGECTSLALSTCSMRERGKQVFAEMMQNTCNAAEKLQKLETLWPSLLQDIVRNTLLDYAQLDVYLCNLMIEIMK